MMLGSALAFSAVFTGPWGSLKLAAFEIGSLRLAGFCCRLPGAEYPGSARFVRPVRLGWDKNLPRHRSHSRKAVANQSQILLPLGLCAWIAFTISFAFPKLSYILSVLSDPLGWGWNLLGISYPAWSPDVSWFSPVLQAAILLVGLFWSTSVARRLERSNTGSSPARMIPVLVFCLAFSLVHAVVVGGLGDAKRDFGSHPDRDSCARRAWYPAGSLAA